MALKNCGVWLLVEGSEDTRPIVCAEWKISQSWTGLVIKKLQFRGLLVGSKTRSTIRCRMGFGIYLVDFWSAKIRKLKWSQIQVSFKNNNNKLQNAWFIFQSIKIDV